MTKKLLSVVLTILMVLSVVPMGITVSATDGTSGSCGDNLTWIFDAETNKLSIIGTGNMNDYSNTEQPWYDYMSEIKTIVIGDEITSIGSRAFMGMTNVTSVTIPNSVTSIGDFAFANCGFTSLTIGIGVKTIMNYTFLNCNNLEKALYTGTKAQWDLVTIGYANESLTNHLVCREYSGTCGNNLTWIMNSDTGVLTISGTGKMGDYSSGSTPWNSCLNYINSVVIENGVKNIGDSAFSDCTNLVSVTLSDSIKSIGYQAFYNCTSLNNISIPDSVTTIEYGAFRNCKALADENNFVIVKNILFSYYSDDTDVVIPDNVKSISSYAFYGNTTIESVTIPDSVTKISPYAFYNCTNLTSVTFGSGLTDIGESTFNGCTGLSSIALPDQVINIDSGAFLNCKNLSEITLGDNVENIGSNVFYGTGFYNNEDNYDNGYLYLGKYLIKAKTDITECSIKDDTKLIAGNAFYSCKSITDVKIPNSVISIGNSAFSNCTELTTVEIPNSVTTIGSNAFYSCTKLASISMSDNIISLGSSVIDNTAYYKDSANWDNGILYLNKCVARANTSVTESIVKDETWVIAQNAFLYCTSLTSVSIPSSIKAIGDNAFSSCSAITNAVYRGSEDKWASVKIGDGNDYLTDSLTFAGSGTCGENLKWALDTETGVLTITGTGDMTDYDEETIVPWKSNIDYIKSVVISDGVTNVGDCAFCDCPNLVSVTIENSVKTIDDEAFYNCSSLKDLIIGNGVTNIGYKAFNNCSSLKNIVIGKNVKNISSYAFSGCTGLTSVTIPETVTTVSKGAFNGCYSLADVYYNGRLAQWNNIDIASKNTALTGAALHCAVEPTTVEPTTVEPTTEPSVVSKKFYYVPSASDEKNDYTYKAQVKVLQPNGQNKNTYITLNKTSKTYKGMPIYSLSLTGFTDVARLTIQSYSGTAWKSQVIVVNSTTTDDLNQKMYDKSTKTFGDFTVDTESTFYYVPSQADEDAGYTYKAQVKVKQANGQNKNTYITLTKTIETYRGVPIYKVSLTGFTDVTRLTIQNYSGANWKSQVIVVENTTSKNLNSKLYDKTTKNLMNYTGE